MINKYNKAVSEELSFDRPSHGYLFRHADSENDQVPCDMTLQELLSCFENLESFDNVAWTFCMH